MLMATLQSQSRLSKSNYCPTALWCNISLNSFLLTFLSTSGGKYSNKQPNDSRDQNLDTYHSLTFRLPTWSVPTAVLDADFWACQVCNLACKCFWLATVFRIYLQHLLTTLWHWEKLSPKVVLYNISSLHSIIYKCEMGCTQKHCLGWCLYKQFWVFFLIYKNISVLFAKTKISCRSIAVISAQCFWTGSDLLYLYLEEFGPERQKSNNMWFRVAAEPVTSHQLVI